MAFTATQRPFESLCDRPLTGAAFVLDITDLEARLDYMNVHTTAFPGGEIRGQLEMI